MSTAATVPNGEATDWRASLPEDLRSVPSLEKFKDSGSLAKSYLELEKMTGNAIRLPKPDASPEELDKFYSRLGRPESPEKYELKRPELPEGVPYNEELEIKFKSWAHRAGLQPRQAQALLEQFNADQLEVYKASAKAQEDAVAELKKEFGGDYEKKIGAAKGIIQKFGDDALKAELDDPRIGSHPGLVRMLVKLADELSEPQLVVGEETGATGETADQIRLKIDAIRKDKAHPYNSNIDNEAKQAALREMQGLYARLALASQK